MDCSWYTGSLKMIGKCDRFHRQMVLEEFSERMRKRVSYDFDLDRKLDDGDGERPIFATRVCGGRYVLYWELDKNKSTAYVLAFTKMNFTYFKSVRFLEDFIKFFEQTHSFSRACSKVADKNRGELIVNNW